MKKIFTGRFNSLLVAAILAVFLSSCGYFAKYSNRDNAMKLRKGMTKEEVLEIMGEPLKNQKYSKPDIWFYYIETRWYFDCQSTKDECLPIVFKDGKIQGWGVEYYKENVEFPLSKEKHEGGGNRHHHH